MSRNDLAAVLLALCGASITIGFALVSVPAGFDVAGALGAVLVWLLVVDVGKRR